MESLSWVLCLEGTQWEEGSRAGKRNGAGWEVDRWLRLGPETGGLARSTGAVCHRHLTGLGRDTGAEEQAEVRNLESSPPAPPPREAVPFHRGCIMLPGNDQGWAPMGSLRDRLWTLCPKCLINCPAVNESAGDTPPVL